jgi:hypothetical protein
MSGKTRKSWVYGALALVVAVAAGIDAARGAPAQEEPNSSAPAAESIERVQRSAEGYTRDREPDTLRDVLTFKATRTTKREAVQQAKGADVGAVQSIQYGDDWVYDAGTDLLIDADRDGYYRYLRVHFDVDSYLDRTYVFARLYTSPDGESWDFYYETDDFLVTGTTPDDAYEVESELLANYPPDLYDVLVEIYDADTGTLVDEFGPAESSALSLLPLEDASFDGVPPAPVVVVSDGHGGGGSISWLALLSLAGAAVARRGRKKKPDLGPGDFGGPSDELAR